MPDLNKQIVDTQPQTPDLIDISEGVPTGRVQTDNSTNVLLGNLERLGTQASTIALSNITKDNQIHGAMLSATQQDLPEDVNYATKTGFQLNEVKLASEKFLSEEKSFIADKGKNMTPESYSARYIKNYNESVEGLSPSMRSLADAQFIKNAPLVATAHRDAFLANNRVRSNDTALEVVKSTSQAINTSTGKIREQKQKDLDNYILNKMNGLSEQDALNVLHTADIQELASDNKVLADTYERLGIRRTPTQQGQSEQALRGYSRLQEKKLDEAFVHDQLRIASMVQNGASDATLDASIKAFETKYKDSKSSFHFSNASLRWHQAAAQARGGLQRNYDGNELYRQGKLKGNREFDPKSKELQTIARDNFRQLEDLAQQGTINASGGDQEKAKRLLPAALEAARQEQRNLWNNNGYVHNFLRDKWTTELSSVIFTNLKEGQRFNPDVKKSFLEMQEYEKMNKALFNEHMTDEDSRLRYDRINRQMKQGQSFEEAALFAKRIEENPKITDQFAGISYEDGRSDVIENIRDTFDKDFFGRSFKDNLDMNASIEARLQYEIVTKPHLNIEDAVANVTHQMAKEFEVMNNELKPNFGKSVLDRMQDSYNSQGFIDEVKFKRDVMTNTKIDENTTQEMYDWMKGELIKSTKWKNFSEDEDYFVEYSEQLNSMIFFRRDDVGNNIQLQTIDLGKMLNAYNKEILIPEFNKLSTEARSEEELRQQIDRTGVETQSTIF